MPKSEPTTYATRRTTRSLGTIGIEPSVKKERPCRHVQVEYEEDATNVENPAPGPTTPKRERKPSKRELAKGRWQETYSLIEQQRAVTPAPVDTMGCERAHDITRTPKEQRYESLVSLMLSSQTKDEVTSSAVGRLQEHGLTVASIIDIETETLEKLIFPVGFYRRKAVYLKETAVMLRDQYDSDIPRTIKEMVKLKGVGPKMAHLLYNIAWASREDNVAPSGIGVDVHVHRISNRLGWVKSKTPEETREQLEELLPQDLWIPVNPLLVGFGQTVCKANYPKCGECAVAHLCPSASVRKGMARANTK